MTISSSGGSCMISPGVISWRAVSERETMRWPSQGDSRSEEHTSELQSLMRISYAVFCLQKKKTNIHLTHHPGVDLLQSRPRIPATPTRIYTMNLPNTRE